VPPALSVRPVSDSRKFLKATVSNPSGFPSLLRRSPVQTPKTSSHFHYFLLRDLLLLEFGALPEGQGLSPPRFVSRYLPSALLTVDLGHNPGLPSNPRFSFPRGTCRHDSEKYKHSLRIQLLSAVNPLGFICVCWCPLIDFFYRFIVYVFFFFSRRRP